MTKFSAEFDVRRLTFSDIPQIYDLCKENKIYYQYAPPFVTEMSIKWDMRAPPPKKTLEDKYYVGYFYNENLITILDLIQKYLDEDTVFIVFFMVDAATQRVGVGSRIIDELLMCLSCIGFKSVRLGWVAGNIQAMSFWRKNGFSETGVSYSVGDYTIIVAEHNIQG